VDTVLKVNCNSFEIVAAINKVFTNIPPYSCELTGAENLPTILDLAMRA
jgi:hypothetical protein